VADDKGDITLPPDTIGPRLIASQLKDFRVHIPGEPAESFAKAEYLGQDGLSGWNFIRVEEKARAKLTPVTAFAAASSGEPAAGEEVWGIGLRGKDEDFLPYLLTAKVSMVQSLPERTAVALAEVAAPGLPVFNHDGAFLGIAVGGFGSSYVEFSRAQRGGMPIMLIDPEESRVFQLASAVTPWLARVPTEVNGRPIPWFGAYGLESMDPDVASFLNLVNQSGCVVSEVLEGSPAETAGLKPRDIIVAVDGKPLPRLKPDRVAVDYFERLIDSRKPGDKFPFTVLRGTERVELTATLGDEPKLAREADRKYFENLGLTVREFVFGDAVVRRIKQADKTGVIAHFVKSNTPVSAAGLGPDDWIQEIDGAPVKTFAEAVAKFTEIDADPMRAEMVLLISRNGETQVLRVKLK